jgi:death-on-curing protein
VRYLTTDQVILFNEDFAGPGQLRDFGLLESAVFRPQSSAFGEDAYSDVPTKAAALFHSLVRNHPFVDGNKRTAAAALLTFLRMNGYRMRASDPELIAWALDTAEGVVSLEQITGWVKNEAVLSE